jgi:hypothetical protein
MPPSSDPVLVVLKSQLVSALNPNSKISVGNGAETPFWDAPWLDGETPKKIAHLIYMTYKTKSKQQKRAAAISRA